MILMLVSRIFHIRTQELQTRDAGNNNQPRPLRAESGFLQGYRPTFTPELRTSSGKRGAVGPVFLQSFREAYETGVQDGFVSGECQPLPRE